MLESMDSFVVEALIANGQVEIFIGLDPTKVTENEYLWKVENVGGIATISVAQTDKNFHMATFYYIYTRALGSSNAIFSI
jgi:hypothetical protein